MPSQDGERGDHHARKDLPWCKFDGAKHPDPGMRAEHDVYGCLNCHTLICVHASGLQSIEIVCGACSSPLIAFTPEVIAPNGTKRLSP
jgi:hypothetical protein